MRSWHVGDSQPARGACSDSTPGPPGQRERRRIPSRHTPIEKNAYSRLRIGSEAPRRDLLHIALMSSENLACHVLARGESWDILLSKTGFLNESGRCLIMIATVGGRAVTIMLLDSFGARSPVGDAARVKRWLETGSSRAVAGAARDYERQRTAAYRAGQPVAAPPARAGVPGG